MHGALLAGPGCGGDLAQDGEVALRHRVTVERRLAGRVEHQVARLDDEVGAGELGQLDELGVREGRLHGAATAEHENLADARSEDGVDRRVGRVRRPDLLGGERQHPGHVDRDVAVPDDDGALPREVELELLEVGVAVVPGDERGGRPGAGQVLAGDPHAAVGLRPERVHDRVVEPCQLLVGDVATNLDVPEEAKARPGGDLLEDARDGLDVGMVGSDAEADEAPRRRQPLEQVDLRGRIRREKVPGGVEPGRPGTDDGDAQRHGSILAARL